MAIADKYLPQEIEGKWYDYWIAHPEGKRFYKYLQNESTGEFVGEIAYHYDEEEQKYIADVKMSSAESQTLIVVPFAQVCREHFLFLTVKP